MDPTPSQRASRDVSPIDGAYVRLDPQQISIGSNDSLTDLAASVSTSLMTEEHAKGSTAEPTTERQEMFAENATLQRTWYHRWDSALLDVVGAVISLFFLVIAVLCLTLNGKPVSAYGQDIKAITLLSPTIFPIVYAAILGRLLRRIGLFKAERGSTIGTLEQLIGSQSVFSSIERQFGLRRVDLLGVAIIIAWLLSPVGGQASLRLLSVRMFDKAINATVHHHPVDTFYNSTLLTEGHMEEKKWGRYAPLFMSTLQLARQNYNLSRDMLGNIRIPDIASLITGSAILGSDWYNISNAPSLRYTSLLGSPVVGIPSSGNTTFMLESGYWEVQCDTFTGIQNITFDDETPGGRLLPTLVGPTFDIITSPLERPRLDQIGFRYVTKVAFWQVQSSRCIATLRIVESSVGCQGGICEVQRMRKSSRSDSILSTLMPEAGGHKRLFGMLTEFLPGADLGPACKSASTSELVEQWISDPSLTNATSTNFEQDFLSVNLSNLPPEIFSQRLQVALNTFWDTSLGLNYWAVNATAPVHDYKDTISTPWTAIKAQGVDHDTERYVCNITYAIITIVISLLLFAAAVTSAFLGFITKAPDILGYVSSLARDDPYFGKAVPSHHNGLEAARALRDVRVIIGDVRHEDEVGHIAFAAPNEVDTERVSRKRIYD